MTALLVGAARVPTDQQDRLPSATALPRLGWPPGRHACCYQARSVGPLPEWSSGPLAKAGSLMGGRTFASRPGRTVRSSPTNEGARTGAESQLTVS
jgi:hypothetical protein